MICCATEYDNDAIFCFNCGEKLPLPKGKPSDLTNLMTVTTHNRIQEKLASQMRDIQNPSIIEMMIKGLEPNYYHDLLINLIKLMAFLWLFFMFFNAFYFLATN